ncbi:MAG: c-type cytochrome [Thermodesulfobacteriota bacterium]
MSRSQLARALSPVLAAAALLSLAAGDAAAAGGKGGDVLQPLGCAGCHLLTAPPDEQRTLAAYAKRKGPDLFYAGSKYRDEWLRDWLARPRPIRPAGLHPAERTTTGASGDAVGGAAEPDAHPAVPAAKVDAVASALLRLDWGKEKLPAKEPEAARVPRPLAELNFVKFKGCGSCHRTSDDAAPLSGPDLDDAFVRLRPEFLASFIANPQAWDPVAPMPNYALPEAEVAKLVAYLRILSEENDVASAH